MLMKYTFVICSILLGLSVTACEQAADGDTVVSAPSDTPSTLSSASEAESTDSGAPHSSRFDIYAKVRLEANLDHLSDKQKKMVGLLIDAAKITDEIFWLQVWGDKNKLLASIEDPQGTSVCIL